MNTKKKILWMLAGALLTMFILIAFIGFYAIKNGYVSMGYGRKIELPVEKKQEPAVIKEAYVTKSAVSSISGKFGTLYYLCSKRGIRLKESILVSIPTELEELLTTDDIYIVRYLVKEESGMKNNFAYFLQKLNQDFILKTPEDSIPNDVYVKTKPAGKGNNSNNIGEAKPPS